MTRIQNRAELIAGADGKEAQARRALALDLFDAALAAVDPLLCTRRVLRELCTQGKLSRPVTLFAFGKAARGMTEAALSEVPVTRGIVIGFETGRLGPLQLYCGSHPVPSDDAPEHGEAMLKLAHSLTADDLALVLISGGGSALLEVPRTGLTLSNLQAATRVLLASGASIQEVNAVRSALSAVKGGKLAHAMAPAQVINVVLSDVVGSPLASIASGPTAPAGLADGADLTTIVERYGLTARLPPAVQAALKSAMPMNDDFEHVTSVIAADNLTAQEALVHEARKRGHHALRRQAYVEGEARLLGPRLWREAQRQQAIYVAGGETTVTLGANVGCGGRNQELVLSAGAAFSRDARMGSTGSGLFAAMGTDGIDGASEAAGGLFDASLLARIKALGLEPSVFLTRHDAGTLLSLAGGAIRTGRTGTNVADLTLVWP